MIVIWTEGCPWIFFKFWVFGSNPFALYSVVDFSLHYPFSPFLSLPLSHFCIPIPLWIKLVFLCLLLVVGLSVAELCHGCCRLGGWVACSYSMYQSELSSASTQPLSFVLWLMIWTIDEAGMSEGVDTQLNGKWITMKLSHTDLSSLRHPAASYLYLPIASTMPHKGSRDGSQMNLWAMKLHHDAARGTFSEECDEKSALLI